ncbi:MAG: GNAT family N-acetyltransferase [Massilibacteroides sp.]|nr:GNAT family N-acetyltransferase [Massilibacteroides sp.]MDD3061748.1 GNAT family N-acetyltransferase [Massilibacteroides sp.]MDD4114691.1 GNAT family N-acetyltransferase [Massilibacteroides sp.]MDD4661348.1 GNAT family N-acetyltransferase [Massilibacteroides sp.]
MKLLENNRLRLRALEPEDLELLYKWENDASLWTLGSTVSPYSYYILKKYISESHKNIYEQRQQRLMVVCKENEQTIGMVDLYDFDPHNSRAGIGVLIDIEFQGKGYAGEAIRLIIDYAFLFLKLNQLYVHIPIDNKISRRLFTSCGFEESGVLHEWNSVPEGFSDVCIMQRVNR